MIIRVLIAGVGALVVTASLLLAMDALTSLFERQDGERLFSITDILPKPEPGRPERPQAASRLPATPEQEAEPRDAAVPIDAPSTIDTEPASLQGPELAEPDAPPE